MLIYFRPDQTKYLQFREKNVLIWAINFIIKSITQGIEILAKRLLSFSVTVFSLKLLVILFIRKKKHLLRNIHPIHVTGSTLYRIDFFFFNYVYLKDMYITLKGIGKNLFVSVLRTLLICELLSFTAAFTKQN